jgi:putative nucleotidyltransferase with HDIG domain
VAADVHAMVEKPASLVRVPIGELRLGMYVHKLGGSWFKHPFLRGSFLLTDPQDLAAIKDCGIDAVWIDAGAEPPPGAPPAAPCAPPDGVPAAAPTTTGCAATHKESALTMAQEVTRAKRICLAARCQITDMFRAARLGKAIDPGTTMPLVDEIAASVERQPVALLSVARLKTHDDYTYLHSVAVCALMLALARQLRLDPKQTRLAGIGGLMHDLGKAAMPLDVLNKPGKLTDTEFATMKRHPVAGAEMLRVAGADAQVQDIALHHHERVDGTGYPDRLAGEQISLLARMGAICDVYDAVTSQRAYKQAWDPSGAMHQMAKWEGHFDRHLFNAFVKSVGIYPVGSLVRLASQRLAVVCEPGLESLLKPTVRVFFSVRAKEPIALQTIDLAAPGCRDSIIGPEDPQPWGFRSLDELWLP